MRKRKDLRKVCMDRERGVPTPAPPPPLLPPVQVAVHLSITIIIMVDEFHILVYRRRGGY